jgi:hypothetical protein
MFVVFQRNFTSDVNQHYNHNYIVTSYVTSTSSCEHFSSYVTNYTLDVDGISNFIQNKTYILFFFRIYIYIFVQKCTILQTVFFRLISYNTSFLQPYWKLPVHRKWSVKFNAFLIWGEYRGDVLPDCIPQLLPYNRHKLCTFFQQPHSMK